MVVDLIGNNQKLLDQFLIPFVQTYTAFTLAFGAFLFLIGRSLSHRVAGPVYAFERFVKNFIAGKPQKLKLRKNDEFLHLEEIAKLIIENLTVAEYKALIDTIPILPHGKANTDLNQERSIHAS
jgi:signal peptidase II